MTDPTKPLLVPERIAAIAAAGPGSVALVQGDRTISYGELISSARVLAARLREAGVRPGGLVGVNLDRSPEAVVGLLATWLAGAAYVPLPPGYPAERLRFLLADSGAEHVLSPVGGPSFSHGVTTVAVHGPAAAPEPPQVEAPQVELRPEATAYLIYTSGSTGAPKGVRVSHLGIANLVDPRQSYVRFSAEEVFLQLAPLAFDASAFEIWGALGCGARLVLAPTASYQTIEQLPAILREQKVSTLLLTPPLFHALMSGRPEALDGVSRLIVGGDAMSAAVARTFVDRAAAQCAPRTLHNVYGPTEATTLVSAFPMTEVAPDARHLPIGRAIEGAALYLLDDDLVPVPAGAQGQIFIGGVAVAHGYQGRPGLTAQRFLPDPFAAEPGRRMYATGDLGERGADGVIRFLGRADDQVKVRGYRVEPREIEFALEQHPDVDQACVVLADGQLVAHLVAAHHPAADPADLAKHLGGRLPEFMVPAHYTYYPALPVGPTGKVDRARLAQLGVPEAHRPAVTDAPRSGLEETLIAIWQDVLGLTGIGPEDDFFVLGGDSISAIGVVGEAEDRGIPLTIAALFTGRTIRAICAELGENAPVGQAPIPGEQRVFPATRMQLGLIYESQMSQGAHYIDVVARQVTMRFDETAFRQAVRFVTDRHDLLRARFDLGTSGEPEVVVEPTVTPSILVSSRRETAWLSREFDISTAPLIRFHVETSDQDGFRLAYAFHHAIMDGWSESVLAVELMQAYVAALGGARLDLPAVPSYAEYANLEHAARSDPATRGRVAALFGRLPRDERPHRPNVGVPQLERAIVPAETLAALRERAAAWKLPMKSLLFAVTGRTFTTLRRSDEALIWMSVHGRPELPGADRMVGLFLNWLPMAVAADDWEPMARRSFAAEAELLPVRRFPFTDLKEVVGQVPMEIAFNYLRFRLTDELRRHDVQVTRDDIYDRTSLPILVEFHEEAESLAADVRADAGRYPDGYARSVLTAVLAAADDLARTTGAPE